MANEQEISDSVKGILQSIQTKIDSVTTTSKTKLPNSTTSTALTAVGKDTQLDISPLQKVFSSLTTSLNSILTSINSGGTGSGNTQGAITTINLFQQVMLSIITKLQSLGQGLPTPAPQSPATGSTSAPGGKKPTPKKTGTTKKPRPVNRPRAPQLKQTGPASWINSLTSGLQGINSFVANPNPQAGRGAPKSKSFMGKAKARGKQALGFAVQGMQNPNNLQGAGSGLRAMGSMAGMIPAVGKPIEAFTKLADVVLKTTDRLQKWMDSLHEQNMQFAEFSSSMSKVKAEQQVRDMKLSQQKGEARAGSAKYLAEGKSQLAQATAPFENIWAEAKGAVGGFFARGLAMIIDPLGKLVDYARGRDKDKPLEQRPVDANEWMMDMGRDVAMQYGKRNTQPRENWRHGR